MSDFLPKLKLWHWVLIALGLPLLLLISIGLPAYYYLGIDAPIWKFILAVSPLVNSLTTMSLVLLTLVYAFAQVKMTEVMKLDFMAKNTPSIIAYFDNPQSILFELVVKNIGNGIARNIRVEVNPTLLDVQNRDISKLSLFQNGIDYFPPDREYRQIIGTSRQFFDEKSRPLRYDLTIYYSDVSGNEKYQQKIPLDFSVYQNLPVHRDSDIEKLVEEVSQLTRTIESTFRR